MKALQITGPNAYEIIEIPKPVPGEGEVLIRVGAVSICNQHESKMFAGPHPEYPRRPGWPGHEGAGEVIALGPGVKELAVGDRVVMRGPSAGGTPLHCEVVTRPEASVVKYHSDVSFAEAAPMELYGCVHRAVNKASSVKGRRTAVVGLGPAGLVCCQVLSALGAGEIAAVDFVEERLAAAVDSGATETVNASRFDEIQRVLEENVRGAETGALSRFYGKELKALAPLVIDCSGSAKALQNSFVLAEEELVIFGYTVDPVTAYTPVWFERELMIKNSKILSHDDFRAVTALMDEGRIHPGRLISREMHYPDYGEALAAIRAHEVVKIAISWD
jgi:threonine dehydrogenase-like Zn-dependent dehydrogenase